MKRKDFIEKIIYIFGILLIIGIFNYIIDAQQQIRYNENWVAGEQRVINNGIARNYNYDTVIIGSSTSENILKEDVDKLFNTNSINLSLSGSTALEHRNLLNLVIEKENVRSIIYGLDYFNYNREGTRIEVIDYGKSKIELLKYIFNITTLKINLKIVVKEVLKKNIRNWIYKHSYWGGSSNFSEENLLTLDSNTQFGVQNLGAIKEIKNGYKYDILKYNFDEFLKIVEKNKNIEYIIYLPPYSSYYWYFLERYDSLKEVLKFKKYIYDKSKNYDNISIHDFQDRIDIVNNLNNYRDLVHFSDLISKKIIGEIKRFRPNSEYDVNFSKKINKIINKDKKKFEKTYLKYGLN